LQRWPTRPLHCGGGQMCTLLVCSMIHFSIRWTSGYSK
jgi:hypothetical protein